MTNSSVPAVKEKQYEAPLPGAYRTGDKETRPWGHYVVIDTGIGANGEEYCKKTITVEPLQILSLQSHNMRRETWLVKRGILTALKDGRRVELHPGESIQIPAGSLHCMANINDEACVVEETQEGVCREEDIQRYMDAYHRDTAGQAEPQAMESFTAYREILIDINKIKVSKKNGVPY